jgi:hypothetical protein
VTRKLLLTLGIASLLTFTAFVANETNAGSAPIDQIDVVSHRGNARGFDTEELQQIDLAHHSNHTEIDAELAHLHSIDSPVDAERVDEIDVELAHLHSIDSPVDAERVDEIDAELAHLHNINSPVAGEIDAQVAHLHNITPAELPHVKVANPPNSGISSLNKVDYASLYQNVHAPIPARLTHAARARLKNSAIFEKVNQFINASLEV